MRAGVGMMTPTRIRRCLLAVVAVAATILVSGPSAPARATAVPPLRHIFVIVEENQNFSDVFGAKAAEAPYLNALADAHVRSDAYYGISHLSIGNYIGMVSGQIPGPFDHFDCPPYQLCVRTGPTIGAQLDGAGFSWKAYLQTMPAPCTVPSGLTDNYQTGYATRHNPFVYFSEIVGNASYCASHDVAFAPSFATDLASPAGPANLSFVVPDTCDDGHDAGCHGTATTIQNMDNWLAGQVPPILDYVNGHADSALFVVFDEAANTDTSGCCNQLPLVQGGGRVGLVTVAPAYEKAQYRSMVPANHYSLLRTIEDSFGVAPLGEAQKVAPMTDLFR